MAYEPPPLRRTALSIPELSSDPSPAELARQFATLAGAYHQQWPALVGKIDELDGKIIAAVSLSQAANSMGAELKVAIESIDRQLESRAKAASEPLIPQTVTEVLDARELKQRRDSAEATAKFRGQVAVIVVAAVILAVSAYMVGRFQAMPPGPPLSIPTLRG